MGRGITLTRYAAPQLPVLNNGDGVRIRIVAGDGLMMGDEVFLLKRETLDALTGASVDEFCAVASPEDLITVPLNSPDLLVSPYFLSSQVDAIVDSLEVSDAMWVAVKARVCELLAALDRKDDLSQVDVAECGTPEAASSESMSTSMSASM